MIKTILSKELSLRVFNNRFYDARQEFSYPIKVVIYNNKSMLGYFDPLFFELGFHECLMHSNRESLHNLIRHEIAHYMTFIAYGENLMPHGHEFKAFCQSKGWGEEVWKATFCLDNPQNSPELAENAILRKVQKLMALSTSSNSHEAEQAMIKSQQLLLKHNLEAKYLGSEEDEKIVLKRILRMAKLTEKMRAIAAILETFFVSVVYNRTSEGTHLEILGDSINVEIAEYVAEVLDSELEILWNQAKRLSGLKGALAKNSFFLGLARGYCEKIQALKKGYAHAVIQALMVIEKKLSEGKEMAYRRLKTSKRSGRYCPESAELGELMGRQLSINPALSKTSANSGAYISHSSH